MMNRSFLRACLEASEDRVREIERELWAQIDATVDHAVREAKLPGLVGASALGNASFHAASIDSEAVRVEGLNDDVTSDV